ncbi:MAG: beta-propeller domain-containing protein [Polyangiaceae bacterium]|nr:beta-propeller domain-containing protein [Polyangiaceae bacterium]
MLDRAVASVLFLSALALTQGCTITSGEPGEPDETGGTGAAAPDDTGGRPSGEAGSPSGEAGSPSGEAGNPAGGTADPSGTAGNPSGTAGNPGGGPSGDAGSPTAGAGGTRAGATLRPPLGPLDDGTGGSDEVVAPEDGPAVDELSRAAVRIIQEADIVQFSGNRLYAISRVGGLSIIDVETRDRLRLLGLYRLPEVTPFEMFIRGERVIVLFTGVPVYDPETYTNETTSRVVALNVADPANIVATDEFDVPGEISDSRIVGNALYLVSYKNEHCYDCDRVETSVTSLDISNLGDIVEVEQLAFPETEAGSGSYSQRSVTVTTDRMYVGGIGDTGYDGSEIQVVDISSPSGDMTLGDTVEVEGSILSRWQMDEYNGVLRVVSQPQWDSSQPPVIQTFQIDSSTNLTPLGRTEMEIPEGEDLRSVRFDDDRAYAITFFETDPLFTIDLSDPANPRQAGELEMPGWIYHMEPRGNFMLGLGFDNTNDEGSLNVTLIDVSDIDHPALLDRANFGGSWAKISEDQNRVHKLFNVEDELGLVFVPYSGYTSGCGSYTSGIQIIEYDTTSLTLRGVAPQVGTARRARIYDERLFGVSEERVQVFDLGDLDRPVETASLPLVHRVHRTIPVGAKVLRVRSDWWTQSGQADLTTLEEVESPMVGEQLNLSAALYDEATEDNACDYYDYDFIRNAPAFAFGSHVAMVVSHHDVEGSVTDILVLDTSGDVPAVSAKLRLDFPLRVTDLGPNVVQVRDSLVLLRAGAASGELVENVVEVVDLSDPTSPHRLSPIERAAAWGTTGFYVDGTDVLLGYYDTSGPDDTLMFFVDRIGIEDPSDPDVSEPLSIPGLLLGPTGEHLLTVDFADVVVNGVSWTTCYYEYGGQWESEDETCAYSERTLKLVSQAGAALSEQVLDSNLQLAAIHRGEDRSFLPAVVYADYSEKMLIVGADGDELTTNLIDLDARPFSSQPVGSSLYFLKGGEFTLLDATNVADPTETAIQALYSTNPNHLALTSTHAVVALDDYGVQLIELP